MKKAILLFLLVLFVFCAINAQMVDTIHVYSGKMDRSIKNLVILPDEYKKSEATKYPVLYLLHGHWGRFDSWITQTKTTLQEEATKWKMIIVCPSGEYSWYWDSPIDPKMQFDTYMSAELPKYMDENFNTIASREGRAVTGYSMGGQGGLWLGFTHPEVFGACGSMSGGVDIRPFPNNWDMSRMIGKYKENEEVWNNRAIVELLYKIEPNSLSIIIDCGTEDTFFAVNEELHKRMLYRNIAHDYIIRPGGHDHKYWDNAIDYQLMFFSKFFYK